MNKKFKVIIKNDPIFKYVIEDYPFYEGLFFHEKSECVMKILKVHYLKRGKFITNFGETNFEFLLHFENRLQNNNFYDFTEFKLRKRFLQHLKTENEIFYSMKQLNSLTLKLKLFHEDLNYMSVNLRKMQTLKLKHHDIYKLSNRDSLTLEQMDSILLD